MKLLYKWKFLLESNRCSSLGNTCSVITSPVVEELITSLNKNIICCYILIMREKSLVLKYYIFHVIRNNINPTNKGNIYYIRKNIVYRMNISFKVRGKGWGFNSKLKIWVYVKNHVIIHRYIILTMRQSNILRATKSKTNFEKW